MSEYSSRVTIMVGCILKDLELEGACMQCLHGRCDSIAPCYDVVKLNVVPTGSIRLMSPECHWHK